MPRCSLSHLSDHVVEQHLRALLARDRHITAALLAHLAEFDARRLYLPAGYASLWAWCVGELHLSEDAAAKRIHAARAAREFPAIFEMVADGRLHLSAVSLLAPHLTAQNAGTLLAAATHKSKSDVQLLLASHAPRPDVPTRIAPLLAAPASTQHAPGHVGVLELEHAPGHVAPPAPVAPPKVTPLAPQRFALQVTIPESTRDKLQYAQELLGHVLDPRDVAGLLDRALDALIREQEKQKLAACSRPRPRRSHANGRYVPAEIKREVHRRDGGRCTFVGDSGHRCESRTRLEFDHVEPVARGGQTTTANLRLRCRAHNQYEAERRFGKGFMESKRREATEAQAADDAMQRDVISALRTLGCRAEDARAIARRPEVRGATTLEERLRRALKLLAPPNARKLAPEPLAASRA